MAREIGLGSPDPIKSMLKPGCVHSVFITIIILTSIGIMLS